MIIAAESNPIWVTLILAALAGLGGGLGVWIINLYKTRKEENRADKTQESQLRLGENQQAFEIMKELLSTVRQDVKTLSSAHEKCEQENITNREENAKLKVELDFIKKELDIVKGRQIEKDKN